MKSKRGQLEILGLAIIMVILLFAFIAYLRLTSDPPAPAQNFFFTELPSQTLSVLLETTTDCKNLKVGTLIADVASHMDSTGALDTNLIQCSNTQRSGTSYYWLFNPTYGLIDNIFHRTFDDAFIKYEFSIAFKDGIDIWDTSSVEDCSKERRVDAETFLIQSDNGPVEVTLKVC